MLLTRLILAAVALIALVSSTMAAPVIGRLTKETEVGVYTPKGRIIGLTKLPAGTTVEVLSVESSRTHIRCGKTKNWVATENVVIESGDASAISTPAGKMYINLPGGHTLDGVDLKDVGTPVNPVLPNTPRFLVADGKKATVAEIVEATKNNGDLAKVAIALGKGNSAYKNRVVNQVTTPELVRELSKCASAPESVSLRAEFEKYGIRPRKQVRKLDSCCLFAVASSLEYEYKKAGENFVPSIAFLNSLCSNFRRSEGTSIEEIFEGIAQKGVCSEAEFPRERIGETPGNTAINSAAAHRRLKIRAIVIPDLPVRGGLMEYRYSQFDGIAIRELQKELIMEEIRKGRPVVVGLKMPGTNKGDIDFKDLDGKERDHAVLITGFTTEDGSAKTTRFEFLNSWGAGWGNGGYGSLPAMMGLACAYSIALE